MKTRVVASSFLQSQLSSLRAADYIPPGQQVVWGSWLRGARAEQLGPDGEVLAIHDDAAPPGLRLVCEVYAGPLGVSHAEMRAAMLARVQLIEHAPDLLLGVKGAWLALQQLASGQLKEVPSELVAWLSALIDDATVQT